MPSFTVTLKFTRLPKQPIVSIWPFARRYGNSYQTPHCSQQSLLSPSSYALSLTTSIRSLSCSDIFSLLFDFIALSFSTFFDFVALFFDTNKNTEVYRFWNIVCISLSIYRNFNLFVPLYLYKIYMSYLYNYSLSLAVYCLWM